MKIRAIIILILTALFCVSCADHKITVIAHRGASSVAPENTLSAFRKAIEFGADYFELDVKASRDDSLMIFHDNTLDRTTDGSGPFGDFTFEQLRSYDAGSWFSKDFSGEKIPTLRESLQLALDYDIKVCVEIKDYDKTPRVVELIEELGVEDRVIIFCFDYDAVAKARQMAPHIPVCFLKGSMTREHIDKLVEIDGEVAGAGGGTSNGLIDYAHSKNVEFWRWTVNNVDIMKNLIVSGVDGIITDYPQEAIQLAN